MDDSKPMELYIGVRKEVKMHVKSGHFPEVCDDDELQVVMLHGWYIPTYISE